MTSFTLEQLRVVARTYAKYLHVTVHGVRIADNCPGNRSFKTASGNFGHAHQIKMSWMVGRTFKHQRIVSVPKGVICVRRALLKESRRNQISLIVHELHHLLRAKGALAHGSRVFQERATLWSFGAKWGFETSEGRAARHRGYEVKKEIETATEINMVEEQAKLVNVRAFRDAYVKEHSQ